MMVYTTMTDINILQCDLLKERRRERIFEDNDTIKYFHLLQNSLYILLNSGVLISNHLLHLTVDCLLPFLLACSKAGHNKIYKYPLSPAMYSAYLAMNSTCTLVYQHVHDTQFQHTIKSILHHSGSIDIVGKQESTHSSKLHQ